MLVHRAAGEPSGLLVLLLEEHDLVQHVDHVDHRVGDPNDHVMLVIRNYPSLHKIGIVVIKNVITAEKSSLMGAKIASSKRDTNTTNVKFKILCLGIEIL